MKYLDKVLHNSITPHIFTVIILVVGFLLLSGPPAVEDTQAASVSRYETQYYDATVSSMSGETHIYYFGAGITPTVPYNRFILRTDGCKVYDSTAKVLVAKATIVWADSAVLMVDETATVGGWLIDMPDDVANRADNFMVTGWYDMMTYERLGATPASTDTLYVGRMVYIQNGEIVSFDNR